MHSVVVTSTDETETGEEGLSCIRTAVDAKEGWVTVQRARKAKDRKVILGFMSKEDQTQAKEKHLLVEEVKNRDPQSCRSIPAGTVHSLPRVRP